MADDEQARRERADRLHEEIEALKSGRPRPAPKSPREFVEEQGRKERDEEEDAEHPPPGGGGQ